MFVSSGDISPHLFLCSISYVQIYCAHPCLFVFLESSHDETIKQKADCFMKWWDKHNKKKNDWCGNHLYLTAVCTTGSSVLFSHIIQLDDFCGRTAANSSSGCAPIFKTKDWQQGGEDRGISEGQQAGCCQVTTFKALENLLFPGSTLCVCFLAVCASINELRGCTLKTTMSLSKLSSRQMSSYHCKNLTQNQTLHRSPLINLKNLNT